MIDIDGWVDHAGLKEHLRTLSESPGLDLESIGRSLDGRELWCMTASAPDGPGHGK